MELLATRRFTVNSIKHYEIGGNIPGMKVLKSCTFGTVYKGLPGLCIMLTFAIAIAITGSLGYLFYTSEILKDPSSNRILPMALRPVEKPGVINSPGFMPVANISR